MKPTKINLKTIIEKPIAPKGRILSEGQKPTPPKAMILRDGQCPPPPECHPDYLKEKSTWIKNLTKFFKK